MKLASKFYAIVMSLLASLLHLSCEQGAGSLSLFPHAPEATELDTESERLNRLQMIRVVRLTGDGAPVEEEVTVGDLADRFGVGPCNYAESECRLGCDSCDVELGLCIANHLLEVARTRAAPFEFTFGAQRYIARPAPTAAQAAAARRAFEESSRALELGVDDIRQALRLGRLTTTPTNNVACTAARLEERVRPASPLVVTPDGTVSVASLMGTRVAEAQSLAREAALLAVDLEVAFADEQRSNPSLSVQISRGVTGAQLSRSSAAHILVGGALGVLGEFGDASRAGLCSAAPLSARGDRALAILRDAGVSPEAVLANRTAVSTADLLDGIGVPGGSVKQRFTGRWGYDFDNPPEGFAVRDSIADYFDLDEQDFEEARRYLAQEITAFSRSFTAQIDPALTPAGLKRYAATAQEPGPIPAQYYAALTTFGTSKAQHYDTNPQPEIWPSGWTSPNLAHITEAAYANSAIIANAAAGVLTPAVAQDLKSALGTVVAGTNSLGRVNISHNNDGEREVLSFHVAGFNSTSGLIVVRGEDGLRCATTGTIEGAPCKDRFVAATPDSSLRLMALKQSGPPVPGYSTSVRGSVSFARNQVREQVYLMRPVGSSTEPGSYEAILGASITGTMNRDGGGFNVPIVPELAERVAEIMAPSPKWCTAPRISCAGTEFDERLPLEDELSEDGDGVESSWKHYLALAKEAAAHADQLGKDYLESGIQYETRLEFVETDEDRKRELAEQKALNSIAELQVICGTAINPILLLNLLSTSVPPNGQTYTGYDLRKVVADAQPPCGAGYKQVLGICVFDIAQSLGQFKSRPEYTDLVELDKCLSEGEVIKYVHLGNKDRPLCVWRDPNDTRRLCEGRSDSFPCPVLAQQSDTTNGPQPGWNCDNLAKPESHLLTETVGRGLQIVDTLIDSTSVKDEVEEVILGKCDQVRALRDGPNGNYLTNVVASGYFAREAMKTLGENITFEARYGTHSAIFTSDTTFTTGTAWEEGQRTDWPCGPSGALGCASGKGLFCAEYDCTDENDRAKISDRLARAAMGLDVAFGPISWVWPVPWSKVFLSTSVRSGARGELRTIRGKRGKGVERLFRDPNGVAIPVVEYGGSKAFTQKEGGQAVSGPVYLDAAGSANRAYVYSSKVGFGAPITVTTEPDGVMFADLRPAAPLSVLVPGNPKKKAGRDYFLDALVEGTDSPGYYRQLLEGQLELGPGTEVAPASLHPLGFDFNYEQEAMLDALELACEFVEAPSKARPPSVEVDPAEATSGCAPVKNPTSVAELPAAARSIACLAEQIKRSAGHTVLTSFPEAAIDFLRQDTVGSTAAGSLGVDVTELRNSLSDLATVPILIGGQVAAMAAEMDRLYFAIDASEIEGGLTQVQLQSTIGNQLTACATAMAPTVSVSPLSSPGGFGVSASFNTGAVFTCANTIAQISFAQEIADLTAKKIKLRDQEAFGTFSQRFSEITRDLGLLAFRLNTALNGIDGQLAKIDGNRDRAKVALFNAFHVHSFTSQYQARINSAQNARFQTDRIRYEKARKSAQRLAFLAKRAVEMRLGIRLSQMTADMPLVDAPASWENNVCTAGGIDFESIADGSQLDYAGTYIGDYLRNLENVVESYRLVNNFHEGTDLAVVSLRDDVANTKMSCEVPAVNTLYNAAQLNVPSSEDTPGWDPVGCATELVDGEEVSIANCIGVLGWDQIGCGMKEVNGQAVPVPEAECTGPVTTPERPILGLGVQSSPLAYTLQFGNKGTCQVVATCSDNAQNQGETGVDCGGPCPACPPPGSSSLPLSASFASGAEGFTYADNVFRGTINAASANGVHNAGKLEVTVGGIMLSPTSGGWSRSFTTSSPGTVDVSFKYSMTTALGIDPGEWVETLVSINNTLYGVSPNDYVRRIEDGGDQVEVTRTFTSAVLPAGTHTLRIGAYMNAATAAAEIGKITIDDVLVSASVPTCSDRVQNQGETGVDCGGTCSPCPSAKCGYRPGAVLAQKVQVSPGTYRASVYVRDPNLFSDIGLQFKLNGAAVAVSGWKTEDATLTTWARRYVKFDVDEFGELSFEFARPTLKVGGAAHEIVLGAPMLERVAPVSSDEPPVTFANTSETLTQVLPVCEDTTGEVFRATKWRRGSAALCQTGYSGECPGSDAKVNGYWETTFNINQRDIESGHIFGNSGFATGNFNYRIESIGVNFVGTEIKNCSESDAPSTCYSAGFVPFSLIHGGPYTFRDFEGKDFEAHLFTGRIENARGLASERYFSSPLSSTDRDLMVDFMRSEFQGRPLDGNFILRVWDAPGLDFQSIEDVQVLLKYRYWTRFN